MQIDLSKRFRSEARALPKARRREIAHALDAVGEGFGLPHMHAGIGLRRLQRNYFECRVGLRLRLGFAPNVTFSIS